MNRLLVPALVLLTASAVLGQSTPQSPAFRAGTDTVSVYATVVDRAGRPVPNLGRDDFRVYDNGVLQPVTLFRNDLQPITIVLMLDRSGSMTSRFDLMRRGAEEFVRALLPDDRVRIGSFSSRIAIDPVDFTSSQAELLRILGDNLLPAGPTPLWNATAAAMDALERQSGRRVVLVFTDGHDNPGVDVSGFRLEDITSRSEREEILVYAIGLSTGCDTSPLPAPLSPAVRFQRRGPGGRGGPGGGAGGGGRGVPRVPGLPGGGRPPGGTPLPIPYPGPGDVFGRGRGGGGGEGRFPYGAPKECTPEKPDAGLKVLADQSGGSYFELRTTDNLGATFARIADELHRQYMLAFNAPARDGLVHQLEVRVNQPGLTVRSRKTYVAGR